ncbi:urease accessory protein UreF [Pannonibacter phragmitetus]|uniref:urease accessory protein UreF n=1 Tax=Pannonibacter phragmitetus TaxID=121719 RepID=UPI003D2EF060
MKGLEELYRLQAFFSPAFPVGAFSYSHGLEQVIEDGEVVDAASLRLWLCGILRHGSGRTDGILLAQSWRAAMVGDAVHLRELAALGLALCPSRERYIETSAQGAAFLATVRNAWNSSQPDASLAATVFQDLAQDGAGAEQWPYPVAAGLALAASGLQLDAGLSAYLHAFAANIISAAVRAVPLGQTDGQRVLAGVMTQVLETAQTAAASGLEELGTCTFIADIASMRHETQYTRLFRT